MALTQPTLQSIPAFDATQPYTFLFIVQAGGAQIVSNQLTIRNNVTGAIVYDEPPQVTFKYEHVLPANTLKNGVNYNASVAVLDATGTKSKFSIPVPFWCYTTPTLTFTNLPTGNIITNASFNFAFEYNQVQGEKLNSYVMNLYNVSKELISTSRQQYVTDGTPPYTGEYLFAGFEDSATYFIELVGETIENTVVKSGQIQIDVKYVQPDIWALVELTNNCSEGYITLKSNVVLIAGKSNPSPPIYIDEKEVDLRNDGYWVKWDEGYSINGNMLARLWFRDPNVNSTILTFSNTDGDTIKVAYREGYVNDDRSTTKLAYITTTVTSASGVEYFIYSDYIPILPATQYYNLWLTRVNNIYQLQFVAV